MREKIKNFGKFINENVTSGSVNMSQQEFNELHDKLYSEGTEAAKEYYAKNSQEFKDNLKWQDDANAVYHNYAVTHMLGKMGDALGINKPIDANDQEYGFIVEEDPKFTKFFKNYSNKNMHENELLEGDTKTSKMRLVGEYFVSMQFNLDMPVYSGSNAYKVFNPLELRMIKAEFSDYNIRQINAGTSIVFEAPTPDMLTDLPKKFQTFCDKILKDRKK